MTVAAIDPCSPLEFTVQVEAPGELALGALVCASREIGHWGKVHFYGVVDEVDLTADYLGHVRVTRIEPDLFFPPQPGSPVVLPSCPTINAVLPFAWT